MIHTTHSVTRGNGCVPGRLMLAGFMLFWIGITNAANKLEVGNAWIREAPPGAPMLAGYLCIKNTSDAAAALIDVESPAFDYVMMHRTETTGGMARMLHQDKVIIPPGERVCLEPGGLHLMMPTPAKRPLAGDQIELILQFADAPCIRVQVPVKAP